jgi:putative chitinase
MRPIDAGVILAIMPLAGTRATIFAEPLAATMSEYGITTPCRAAAFLPQIAHESGELVYTREIADGRAYEDRADLGNTQLGDGPRFRGRGLIQVTGRANYLACGKALGLDLIAQPNLLEAPVAACRSAGWFWVTRGLNELSDDDLFGAVTKRINGGYSGLDKRLSYWLRARKVFGL